MPTKRKTPADMLADTARVLYDDHGATPHWRMAVARGLGVDDDTIRRWMSGRTVLHHDHGALRDLLQLARDRETEISRAADDLEEWLHVHGENPGNVARK